MEMYLSYDCPSVSEVTLKDIGKMDHEQATTKHNTVRCRYNAVNCLTNIHERHPIARPLGRGMGYLLWIQHLIDILS